MPSRRACLPPKELIEAAESLVVRQVELLSPSCCGLCDHYATTVAFPGTPQPFRMQSILLIQVASSSRPALHVSGYASRLRVLCTQSHRVHSAGQGRPLGLRNHTFRMLLGRTCAHPLVPSPPELLASDSWPQGLVCLTDPKIYIPVQMPLLTSMVRVNYSEGSSLVQVNYSEGSAAFDHLLACFLIACSNKQIC